MRRNGKVFIVDWDDTILPSTFVDRWQIEQSKDLPLHVSSKTHEMFLDAVDGKTFFLSSQP